MVTEDNATELRVHHFYTEASDLGFKPGFWPPQIPTTLGNGLAFIFRNVNEERAIYHQANGCIVLTIFND